MADSADILALEPRLVSPLCGIVRRLHRVYKDTAEPPKPFIWRAEISNHRFAPSPGEHVTTASGKGCDHDSARRGALGEAVERYCALRLPLEGVRIAPRCELPGRALDPRALVLYSDDQYAALPYARYEEAMALDWVEGECLTEPGPCWLPVQAIYLSESEGLPLLAQQTSNGLAAGATKADATLRALLEIVERDAFMAAWYNRLEGAPVDWRGLPDDGARGVAESYRRRGVDIRLVRLPADHRIPVFAAIGLDPAPGGIAAVVGLGCDLSPARAAAGAILEVGQVRPALRMRLRQDGTRERREALVADPSQVSDLEDHDLLYTDARMLGAFDMWLQGPAAAGDWTEPEAAGAAARLEALLAEIAATGAAAHACDITTPDIAALGLSVVRAVAEDFQPIHFGEGEARLGGRRLYDLPRRLGRAAAAATRASLNPLPHPLS
ncbi:MAG TPA: YcaO-like family protein [Allosphingosinicella sp.]|nr:YcaO-like family protein [Allosphingosinicella sp.]